MKLVKSVEDIYKLPIMEHEQGSIGFLEKIFIAQFIYAAKAKVIVETGSFKGQTTKFISEFLSINNMGGTVYSFDLPEVIVNILASTEFFCSAVNIRFTKGLLPQTMVSCLEELREMVDFAIIDSEHSYNQVFAELSALHPFLKNGAYVFCHDYLPDNQIYAGVVRAVDDFARQYNYNMLPLCGNQIWGAAVLRKPVQS